MCIKKRSISFEGLAVGGYLGSCLNIVLGLRVYREGLFTTLHERQTTIRYHVVHSGLQFISSARQLLVCNSSRKEASN